MKLLGVVGARPQFVKAAVVSRAIAAWNRVQGDVLREVLVHTGQHHDPNMSEVFFRELELTAPHHHLGVAGGNHGEMTGRMLERLEPVLAAEAPDWVIVYGDTNSTLAGALAAAKLRLRVAHVEAGLRSFDRGMPEEINRVVADHLSELLLAPTPAAVANLAREGISGERVLEVGDVMNDAMRFHGGKATPSEAVKRLLDRTGSDFWLATVHRAENTDDPTRLGAILDALGDLAEQRPVVLPLHPRTRGRLPGWRPRRGMHVIEPCGYLDMIVLLRSCRGVLTDSGGLQKEAYLLGRSCLVFRDETEWVELVEGGHVRLVGAERRRIVAAAAMLPGPAPDGPRELYGDGRAGERIVAALAERPARDAPSAKDALSTRWRP